MGFLCKYDCWINAAETKQETVKTFNTFQKYINGDSFLFISPVHFKNQADI